MAQFETHLTGSFAQLLDYIDQSVLGGSVSASREGGSDLICGDVRCVTRVYERYSYLGGNRLIAPDALMVAGGRAAALGVHKYSLRPESPAIGMGDASMFSATDLDYAGNLRLREGRLDPGCFECWLNITGTRIIFR